MEKEGGRERWREVEREGSRNRLLLAAHSKESGEPY